MNLKKLYKPKENLLGVSKGTRRYDLPLAAGAGNAFLRLLIALMSVLGMLALAASFALSAMTERWSEGLRNQASVEIPATDSGGEPVAPKLVREMANKAAGILFSHPGVDKADIVEQAQIKARLAPWLGEDMPEDLIPLPGLISVTFKDGAAPDIKELEAKVKEVAPRAHIDTHDGWLSDVLKFTGALQFAALLVTIVIAVTTLVAVAGGVRSKLSENKEELELLHLMGATDSYIARQFQRHMMILSMQGGAGGVVAGGLLLFVIGLAAGQVGVNLVPDFQMTLPQKAMLILLPLPLAALAMLTARLTVLRVLVKMP